MRLLFFIFFIVVSLPWLKAQKTVVNGTIKGAEGLEMRLYTYSDFISKKEVLLSRKKIDASGNFSFEVPVVKKEVVFAFFKLTDLPAGSIFLESNKKYDLIFDSADYKNPNLIYHPVFDNRNINYRFASYDSTELNHCIYRLESMITQFYTQQFNLDSRSAGKMASFIRRKNIDSLKTVINDKFSQINNSYFDIYKRYSIASVYFSGRTTPRIKLFNEYIWKQPVHLNNLQYMYFFDDFFNDYIFAESKAIPANDIYRNVLQKVSFRGLLDSLGKDTLLKNEVLRETVLLHNMVNWSSIPFFSNDSLKKFMQQFANESKFDIHRMIAANLREELYRFVDGSPAPDFALKTLLDSTITLQQYKGKTTYIFFFTTYCKSCLAEMRALETMPKELSDSLSILFVNCDKERLKLYYFLQDNPMKFPVVHFGNDFYWTEKYGIVSYPQAVIIDKNGNYLKYNALFPSTGLFDYLRKVFKIPEKIEENPGMRRP